MSSNGCGSGSDEWIVQRISDLKQNILAKYYGGAAELGCDSQFSIHPLGKRGVHSLATIEIGANGSTARFFAKTRSPGYAGPQRLNVEMDLLSNTAPKIWAENPDARCPEVFAYYPEHELLLMQFVNGVPLKSLLFDCGWHKAEDLPHAIHLAGEWLARFHSATTLAETQKPFAWLAQSFACDSVCSAFINCSLGSLYDQLVDLIDELNEEFTLFERPLCRIHGEFTPLHVLVEKGRIYVIDFGSSRIGLPYEDIALFAAFYDGLSPWRQFVGTCRVGHQQQLQTFGTAYFNHTTIDCELLDQIVLAFARILALSHYAGVWERSPKSWAASLCIHAARINMRRRFQTLCDREFRWIRHAIGQLDSQLHLKPSAQPENSAFVRQER